MSEKKKRAWIGSLIGTLTVAVTLNVGFNCGQVYERNSYSGIDSLVTIVTQLDTIEIPVITHEVVFDTVTFVRTDTRSVMITEYDTVHISVPVHVTVNETTWIPAPEPPLPPDYGWHIEERRP